MVIGRLRLLFPCSAWILEPADQLPLLGVHTNNPMALLLAQTAKLAHVFELRISIYARPIGDLLVVYPKGELHALQ